MIAGGVDVSIIVVNPCIVLERHVYHYSVKPAKLLVLPVTGNLAAV